MEKLLFTISIFLVSVLFFTCNQSTEKGNNFLVTNTLEVIQKEKEEVILIDDVESGISKLLSGLDKSFIDTIMPLDSVFWSNFSSQINKDFNDIKKARLDPMEEWSRSNFLNSSIDTSLLFYPFSGPDFLHAFQLYPEANEYILLALEPVGSVPNFQNMLTDSIKSYITNLNLFLRDIYLRSYFITQNMITDIEEQKVDGVLSSLYWFIARTNHEIISFEKITLDSDGNIISENTEKEGWNKNGVDGVRFLLKTSKNKIKKLIYFSCDISDQAFLGGGRPYHRNPNLLIFLNKMRLCNTFVKSASYMMHYERENLSFKNVRDIILSKSKSIFQDDTGVPFKYLQDNNTWNVTFFGSYKKPVKDFDRWPHLYQPDLEISYKNPKINKKKLPFSLGYHWKNKFDQNQMLFLRK